LSIEGEAVDLCYRDLDEVARQLVRAERGEFLIATLATYVVGIPSCVMVGELALNTALVGDLPRPGFQPALQLSALRSGATWLV
jgi:hypothetical protein